MSSVSDFVRPNLTFATAAGHRAGEDRFALLAAIGRTGSISAAAKEVGLSYKGAWDAVNALNNLFPKRLVEAKPGGRKGGGAIVTDEGRRVLALHARLSDRLSTVLDELRAVMVDDTGVETAARSLLWSPIMKTSARNTYHGTVGQVRHGAVNSEVTVQLGPETQLTAIVTRQSAEDMKLQPGLDIYALVKANMPILAGADYPGSTSAGNQLTGTVISLETGAVNSEVVLDIGGGKTLTAIVTNASAEALAISPGKRMSALIQASQIILALG